MSNLMPEVHVNKNGVPVKKYVRADGPGTKKAASMPAPVTVDDTAPLRKSFAACIHYALEEGAYDSTNVDIPSGKKLDAFIAETYSRATMEAYIQIAEEQPMEAYQDLLLGVISNRDSDKVAGYILEIVKRDKQKDYEWSDAAKGSYTYMMAAQVYYGLHHPHMETNIGYTPPENILDESDPEVVKALALIELTNRLYDKDDSLAALEHDTGGRDEVVYIADDELVRLVLERPEDVDAIVKIIDEEELSDGATIRAMMSAPVQRLRDGML